MGYGAFTPPEGPVGARRILAHTSDGNTESHWQFNGSGNDSVGVSPMNVVNPVPYIRIHGLDTDTRRALAPHLSNNYTVTLLGNLKTLTQMTIMAWFCPAEVPGVNAPIIGLRGPNTSGNPDIYNFPWDFAYLTDQTIRFLWQTDDKQEQSVTSSATVPLNRWTHVACSRNTAMDEARVYINGRLAGTQTGLSAPNGGGSQNTIRFCGGNAGNALIEGALATVMIQNIEETDDAIAGFYHDTLERIA